MNNATAAAEQPTVISTDDPAFLKTTEVDLEIVIASLSTVHASWLFFATKRCFDIVLASIILILGLPIFALVCLAIKIDSRGPVFFRQDRVRQGLRTFKILKFRTMYVEARPFPLAIYDRETGGYRRLRIDEDPRITRVGCLLRRFSFDELPQIINVLRGEMSFIGPRPLSVTESRVVPREGLVRYAVPSGLTGVAQLRNRSAIVSASRFDGDVEYVANLSVRQEVRLFFATFSKLYDRSI